MKALRWTIINLACITLLILGAIYGQKGCANLFTFATTANALILLCAFAIVVAYQVTGSEDEDITKLKEKAKHRSVPAWLNNSLDVIILLILAWHGWWFTLAMWAVGMFAAFMLRTAAAITPKSHTSRP